MLYDTILHGSDGATRELVHDDEPQGIIDFITMLIDNDQIEGLILTTKDRSLVTFKRTRP